MSYKIIPIASDHAGFECKEHIKSILCKKYIVEDFGTFSEESMDYPDSIHPLAKAINEGKYSFGIILCGSGNGAQMTANKHQNIRAALCWTEEIAKLARMHNNANILALPARFISKKEAEKITNAFLNTDFEGGRHQKRVKKISIKLFEQKKSV